MAKGVRILFIDDHALFREGVVRLLEQEPELTVVAHCATLTEATRIIAATPVDVILLDYDLGGETGADFFDTMKQMKCSAKVLMITGGMRTSATLKALDRGIAGVILKHSDTHQLVAAIRRVAAGETWWDASVLQSLGTGADTPQAQVAKTLTERQRQVLRSILDGLTNKEIAERLQVSETSVKASIQELFTKARVRTRSQLVRVAVEEHCADWL